MKFLRSGILSLSLLVVLNACIIVEEDGDTGDWLSLSLSNSSLVTYTETSRSDSPFGYDPYIFGEYDSGLPGTELWVMEGYSPGSGDCCWSNIVSLIFYGSSSGYYSVSGGNFIALYGNNYTGIYAADASAADTYGTLNVNSYSTVGAPIAGNFSANLCYFTSAGMNCSMGSMQVSGDFLITRETDGYGQVGRGLAKPPASRISNLMAMQAQ